MEHCINPRKRELREAQSRLSLQMLTPSLELIRLLMILLLIQPRETTLGLLHHSTTGSRIIKKNRSYQTIYPTAYFQPQEELEAMEHRLNQREHELREARSRLSLQIMTPTICFFLFKY